MGKLIPLTFFVYKMAGIKLNGIKFPITEQLVPRSPHHSVGNTSKLKI